MHLSCICASKFAPEGQLWLQLAPFLRISRRGWVLVCVSRPRSTGLFSGLFLPQQGIASTFFSGAGRQPISAPPVLFLANQLWMYGSRSCNAVGCAKTNEHRPKKTRSCFSAPEAVLSEVEQRFDCVQVQTHMYPSLVKGGSPSL